MTGSEDRPPAASDIRGDESPSRADERMAELLAGHPRPDPDLKRKLRDEASDDSDELLARLNALEYLDTLVGEIGGDLPQRLGDYRIVGLLGRGGMGTVFEAFQESLERTVALKVLAPSMTSDPRMRKRFRTEARASATLHHQHIVPVFGFGEASGFLYFAMERVDGVSLDKHIAAARHRGETPMEPKEAALRFAGVADALGHAHRRGILHRDVKPGNILVHPDGSLALADFGLSKVVGEQSMSISQQGGFLGTLHYAAPEQARSRPVTPASDLYSLGVTIYECVTGRLPISGESTEAMLQSLLNDAPRPLRQIVKGAPRDLELVLEKLLSKEPEDRYTDGEALARDLLRVAEDEPVQVRRRSLAVRAWRTVRKHRMLSAAFTVAAVLLLVVFVLWRQFVGEEQVARINKHENRLSQAVSRAESEPGPLDGPGGLLDVLVGVDLPGGDGGAEVLALLEEAEATVPDDTRAQRLREAYLEDPEPQASDALRLGRGLEARRILDERIAEAETRSGFVARDSVTWLQLYRLYLARAVASLTASVADPESAGNDLLRASFVRPGAFAPSLLGALVQWRAEAGAAPLLNALEELILKAPADRRTQAGFVVGALLRAVAEPERPLDANLLELDLDYSVRKQLVRRADDLSGPWPAGTERTQRAGRMELALEEHARRAVATMADVISLRQALSAGSALLDDQIAATSPLQSWRVVYALLASEDPSTVALGDGRSVPHELVVRGIEDFVGLGVSVDVLRRMRTGIEQALTLARSAGVAVHRAEARFAHALGDGTRALAAAARWVIAASDDPEAYLCRMECRVLTGDVTAASLDGARAIQLAIAPETVRQRIDYMLERVEQRDPAHAEQWKGLRERFRGGS